MSCNTGGGLTCRRANRKDILGEHHRVGKRFNSSCNQSHSSVQCDKCPRLCLGSIEKSSPLFPIVSRILFLPIYRDRTLTFSQMQLATSAPRNSSTTLQPLPNQPAPCPIYHGTEMVTSPTATMSRSCEAISSTWCRRSWPTSVLLLPMKAISG